MISKKEHIISKFINGTLNAKDRKKVSKEISDYTMQKKALKMNIENRHNFDADNAWNSFQKRISEKKPHKNPKNINLFAFRKIVASVILIIGISIVSYLLYNNFSTIKYSEINTKNEIQEIKLPDGSLITLNHNSKIIFPEKFSKKTRIVEFSGEAFFKIKKNPKRPFIIKTEKAEVLVLGTSFNVEAYFNNIKVCVKTGKVKLSKKNIAENVKLIAGEEGTIKNNIISKNIVQDKNYLSWKNKSFIFENTKLSKAISDINKAYNVNIILENEDLENILITSSPSNKDIDILLDLICSPENLSFIKTGSKILITKKR